MKTLNLSVELSNIALESASYPMSQADLLGKVRSILHQHSHLLGKLTGVRNRQKVLGDDLQLSEHRFDYEQHVVELQLANFSPREGWEVQDIRLI